MYVETFFGNPVVGEAAKNYSEALTEVMKRMPDSETRGGYYAFGMGMNATVVFENIFADKVRAWRMGQ